MNTPIPVGLIGLGRHGSRYLRHLIKKETGGQLVAISRQQVEEGRQQAKIHRIRFFSDYRDLIADPAIQAVLVVAPAALNSQIGLDAIAHRKAVLLEKPLALNWREGKNLVEAANKAGVPLMTGHTLRYEPVIRKIRDISSRLGPWQALRGTMHLEERPEIPRSKETDHGVLLEFGIHLLDWSRGMLPDEPLTVAATITRLSPRAPEKHANINLTTRSGLSCHLDIARVRTKRVTHIDIIWTNERIRADWTTGLLQTFNHEVLTSQEWIPAAPTLVLMLKDFFQALRTSQPVPISGEDGLRAVGLVEACYQAASSKQPILYP